MKLSQTLAGSWVITVPNPEERHWETQLAEFNTDSTGEGSPAREALEKSAAAAFTALVTSLGNVANVSVRSHDPAEASRMTKLCAAAGLEIDVPNLCDLYKTRVAG
jgi:hypothetical protein